MAAAAAAAGSAPADRQPPAAALRCPPCRLAARCLLPTGGAVPRGGECKDAVGAGRHYRCQQEHAAFNSCTARPSCRCRRSVFCKDLAPGHRIAPATLSMLLEAASWAPSHGRTEPWRFVVFDTAQGELED